MDSQQIKEMAKNNIDFIDTGKVVYPKSDMNLSAKDYEEKISWSSVTFSL